MAELIRRDVLIAGAAVCCGISGCSGQADSTATDSTRTTDSTRARSSAQSDRVILGPAASVPIGSGVVFSAESVVVTQPEAGVFLAFDVVCPHQGCRVSSVSGAGIVCPCHNSLFDISTGQPTQGPARQPLARRSVVVDGTDLILG